MGIFHSVGTDGSASWISDESVSKCEQCTTDFTTTTRRHHCRNCGHVFCSKCSAHKKEHVRGYENTFVRVCDSCYGKGEDMSPPTLSRPITQKEMIRSRKICLLGVSGVGKSALVSFFVERSFVAAYSPTITSTCSRNITHNGHDYVITVVDTAGLDECSLFQPQYAIGTHGYVLLYSITDPISFTTVKRIHDRVLECHPPGIPIVLAGTKADARNSERQVSEGEGKALSAVWGCPHVECSARTGINVDKVFLSLLEKIQKDDV
uniref:Rheb2b n=1 Tax=Prokinetoplastina sp. TaxID=2152669 RepID=A0A2R4IKZ0_9EUGL|nr:Rheb2b [Prokinetoplastina sp.]